MNLGTEQTRSEAVLGRLRLGLTSAWDILGDAIRNYRTNGDTNQAAAIALYAHPFDHPPVHPDAA